MVSADMAGMWGSQAETLKLPTSSAMPFVPLFVIFVYWDCLRLLRHGRLSRFRAGIAFGAAAVLGLYPLLLLRTLSTSLPLTRSLRPAELEQLRIVFPHPYVCYSASGEGDRLRIRTSERTDNVMSYLVSIHALQNP
jgi:hypothetical protein